MSPIDHHLRDTLGEHADDVTAGGFGFGGVERRAQRIRRNRALLSASAVMVVVAGGVAAGVTIPGGNQSLQAPAAHHGTSPPTPTSTTVENPPAPRSGAMIWPVAGDGNDDWVRWDAVTASLATQVPTGYTPIATPHLLGVGDTDGGAVAVFVAQAGDHLVAGAVVRSAPGTATAIHDVPDDGDVASVSWVVRVQSSSGPVDDGIVVGAPTTGQISFRLPGERSFRAAEGTGGPRWATVTLGLVRPGDPVAQVQILDGNGRTDRATYEGPIGVGVTFPDV